MTFRDLRVRELQIESQLIKNAELGIPDDSPENLDLRRELNVIRDNLGSLN